MDKTAISFIFYRPYNEKYYEYGMNSVEKTFIIERMEAHTLIKTLAPTLIMDVLKRVREFQTFVVDINQEKILEVGISEEDIASILDVRLQQDNSNLQRYEPENEEGQTFTQKFSRAGSHFTSLLKKKIHPY